MGTQTEKYRSVEEALGESLVEYVTERRTAGTSWRLIAAELTAATRIDLTGEALRMWFHVRADKPTVECA